MFPKIGVPPVIIHFNKNVPYRNHPAMGVPPWPWKPPNDNYHVGELRRQHLWGAVQQGRQRQRGAPQNLRLGVLGEGKVRRLGKGNSTTAPWFYVVLYSFIYGFHMFSHVFTFKIFKSRGYRISWPPKMRCSILLHQQSNQ